MTDTPLPLSGELGGRDLFEVLEIAAARNAYCTIQIVGSTGTSELFVANGQIMVPNATAPDVASRQRALESVMTILRSAPTDSGAFRLVPLSGVPNADSIPRIQVATALQRVGHTHSPQAATSVRTPALPHPQTVPTTAQAERPAQVSAPTTPQPALAAAGAALKPTNGVGRSDHQAPRRFRASQLRRILREGGNLSEHLPEPPRTDQVVDTREPQRAEALRSLIGELASD